jgi:hypothetical protein
VAKSLASKHRRKGGFIMRHEEILASPAYRDLTPIARCLLEEFQHIYRPNRNGQLSISVKNASALLNAHKDTAGRAFYELAEHGFIALKKDHYLRERLAREWALTFEPLNNREPTDDWLKWVKGKSVVKLSMKPRYKKSKSANVVQDCPKKSTSLSLNSGQKENSGTFCYNETTNIQ